ncbi:HdeD family acid-resistance protein [Vibrio genomosp. F10]|uniref:HdeD family acid-resistance protein n=1 Tax=Vibrio genomosp. F10 TaxID=723171 RepID=UPI001300CFBC|nr:DUF308 domain-containing protein [Vibrio genomosp. F10]
MMKSDSTLAIFTGVSFLIIGALSICAPFATGLSVSILAGILLLCSGVYQIYSSFKHGVSAFIIILALINVAIAVCILLYPVIALETLTLLVGSYFIISGITEAIVAFKIRPEEGWGWMLFSAVMSVVLGVMVFTQFPLSALWVLGTLVGIKLMFSGSAILMLGISVRKGLKEA